MSFLIRKILLGSQWKDSRSVEGALPPPWAYGEFIPRFKIEGNSLSLFKVETCSIDDVAPIAGGLSFGLESSSNQFFAGLPTAELESAGFKIDYDGKGDTFHSVVDTQHVSVSVSTFSELQKIVDLFWNGELVIVKAGVTQNKRCADTRGGMFDMHAALMKKDPPATAQVMHFLNYVRSKDIVFHGAEEPH